MCILQKAERSLHNNVCLILEKNYVLKFYCDNWKTNQNYVKRYSIL